VTFKERQEMIQFWGFNCSCSACTLPAEAILASDERVRLINQYTSSLENWSAENNATPEMAKKLIELYKEEKLFCIIADGYKLAAYAYNAVRDRYNALRMANFAINYGLQSWRYMGGKMIDALQLLTSPEDHWTWGQRYTHAQS
jgi:hypothetical protein